VTRTFAAIAFDWDGTAVPGRSTRQPSVLELLEHLTGYAVHVAVVTGTSTQTLLKQLRPWPQHDGHLLACVDRGSKVVRLSARGVDVLYERTSTAHEDAALDAATADLIDVLCQRKLPIGDAIRRTNRRKVDLLPDLVDPPKAAIAHTLAASTAAVRRAGFDALGDVVAVAEGIAAAAGLPHARVTTDAKHIEIGLTDKGDAMRWLMEAWGNLGIGPGLIMVAGDEFGELGGASGSDARMLVHPGLTAVSVGVEPGRVPGDVERRRGGPREFARIIAEQVRRHRTRAVPDIDHDPRWCLRISADPARERVNESLLALSDGYFGVRGSWEEASDSSTPAVLASGVYTGHAQSLLQGPTWTAIDRAATPRDDRTLDMRTGVLVRTRDDGTALSSRFLCRGIPGAGLMRLSGQLARGDGPALQRPATAARIAAGRDPAGVEWMVLAADPANDGASAGGIAAAAVSTVGAHTERIVGMVAHHDQIPTAQSATRHVLALAGLGHDRLLARHRRRWADAWLGAAIDIPADPEMEHAVRFATFHLLSMAGGAESDRELAVGPRGLTGTAYAGHVMWDADVFVLPVLTAIAPQAARSILEYRLHRMPEACARARDSGHAGARFPWESARTGVEVTPASCAVHGVVREVAAGQREEHITADVAWAAYFYGHWTGDDGFSAGHGTDLTLAAARYWASRITTDAAGPHILDVQGPDEYHDHVNDDAFTNQMAAWCLGRAADILARDSAASSDPVRSQEIRTFRDLSAGLRIRVDPVRGVHEQHSGYFDLVPMHVGGIATPPVALDLVVNPALLAVSQAIKQPDVLMAHHLMWLVDPSWPPEHLANDMDYYDPCTAHGSSLSPGVHATLLARLGRADEAVTWLRTAAFIDLHDEHGLAAGGVHLAAMATVWQALVFGFVGLRLDSSGDMHVDPRLPDCWPEITVRLRVRDVQVHLRVRNDHVGVWSSGPIKLNAGGRRVGRMPAIPPGASPSRPRPGSGD
jgi:trehalose/maltose hydrolase-like predicted phosphorylase